MILNEQKKHKNKITINATLMEIWQLSIWLKNNTDSNSGIKINIVENGCDLVDYYVCDIVFCKYSDFKADKEKTIAFIHSLSQESNFGGIRKNEHWISFSDIGFPQYDK